MPRSRYVRKVLVTATNRSERMLEQTEYEHSASDREDKPLTTLTGCGKLKVSESPA